MGNYDSSSNNVPYCNIHHYYSQISDIGHTLIGNAIVGHSDVVGASPVGAASTANYIFILDLTHGYNRFHRDSSKTTRETFKFHDLMRLIWEIWR